MWDTSSGRAHAPAAGRLLETHKQTAHKLELMLRYWELWGRIVANARGHTFCVNSLWMVDGFAGRGLHPSDLHPDGHIVGTPVQAFRAAMLVRRVTGRIHVHLRAVERDRRLAQELERRLVRQRGAADEKPDWRVLPVPFAAALPLITTAMDADTGHGHSSGAGYRSHAHRSLWFIDPDGLRDIPHADLAPLEKLPGAEVIINLDLGGMWRVAGAAEMALADGDHRALLKAANEHVMQETFGGDVWRETVEGADPHDIYGSLAQGYADTFPHFEYRNVYPLHSSRSQRRYFIHLTPDPPKRAA